MNKLITLLFLFTCLMGQSEKSLAQSNTLTDVTRFDPGYFKAIKDADQFVVGYYIFFVTDKAPKGMYIFQLNIYDAEFNLVIEKKMTEPRSTRLISASSNGRSILFRFFNPKGYQMKYKGYDYEGNQVITKSRGITDKYEKSLLIRPNPYADYTGVLPIPGYGYCEYSVVKLDKMNYKMTYYPDDKSSKTWTKKGKSGMVESALKIGSIDELAISLVYSRPKLMSTADMNSHVVAYDVTDGTKKFDINLLKSKFNTIIIGGRPSSEGGNIILYGLDYPMDTKVSKKSTGLLQLTMNKSGEVLDSKRLDWKRDFKVTDEKDKDFGNLHIHDFFQGNDGHTFIIAEQLSMNGGLSALGSVLGGAPNIAFKVEDLLIIDLDKDFKVSHVEVLEKNRNSFSIGGIPIASITAIGMMAEAYGYFDFTYLQPKKNAGDFTLGFIDGLEFNGVTYSDGKYTRDKISLKKKGTRIFVREAKPGYVSILEYTKKTKTLDFRLEKINF